MESTPALGHYPSPTAGDGECDHSNISVFRSQQLEIHVHSPSVRVVDREGYGGSRPLPVFTERDKIQGVVHLDPKLFATPGRLTVTMEGAFLFISPTERMQDDIRKHRHLFFSSTLTFSTGESSSPRSSTLREAITAVRKSRNRRPSMAEGSSQSHHAVPPSQAFPFSFEIPRPPHPEEEFPPTFSTLSMGEIDVRGRTGVERAQVDYLVIAQWEGPDPDERVRVNATILYEPDSDFLSLDAINAEPNAWLEIPLRSDRPVPFKCAITLPTPATFSRSGSLPYFAVFTTKPRSSLLAREIAVDATIAVSLLRQVTVFTSRSALKHSSTSSLSSSVSSEDLSTPSPSKLGGRFLRRMHKSASPISNALSSPSESIRSHFSAPPLREKPLPEIPPMPTPGVMETRTLQTDVSIGFPKRPRGRVEPNQKHPTLKEHTSLPDGLYKGKMQLNKNMLPSINWAGFTVKYFLEVSVLFGQDESRARIPIRIV
ncbi:hypothetical protein BXZ70DRAFT_1012051 [Cristinia sonorae]|uniref:Uncharacterized protein n=1 Tax=Cristinia sonorae TaxID=1940300 RepID=A0A8K0UF92_9AGAR|nr:hypothetical protein BXZ70DRAFT_1012051 [Cristinia sonorae]